MAGQGLSIPELPVLPVAGTNKTHHHRRGACVGGPSSPTRWPGKQARQANLHLLHSIRWLRQARTEYCSALPSGQPRCMHFAPCISKHDVIGVSLPLFLNAELETTRALDTAPNMHLD